MVSCSTFTPPLASFPIFLNHLFHKRDGKEETGVSMGAGSVFPPVLPGTLLLESVWLVFLQHLSAVTRLCFFSPGFSMPVICAKQETGGEQLC